jgi:hypothetical protein
MSFLDSVLADTIGLGYRAVTGNVDPWTKANIVEQTQADVTQALGPNASPQAISDATSSAAQLITSTLTGDQADPSQTTGVRLPGLGVIGSADFLANLQKIVDGALIIGALILAFYIYQAFGSKVQYAFRRQ